MHQSAADLGDAKTYSSARVASPTVRVLHGEYQWYTASLSVPRNGVIGVDVRPALLGLMLGSG